MDNFCTGPKVAERTNTETPFAGNYIDYEMGNQSYTL